MFIGKTFCSNDKMRERERDREEEREKKIQILFSIIGIAIKIIHNNQILSNIIFVIQNFNKQTIQKLTMHM